MRFLDLKMFACVSSFYYVPYLFIVRVITFKYLFVKQQEKFPCKYFLPLPYSFSFLGALLSFYLLGHKIFFDCSKDKLLERMDVKFEIFKENRKYFFWEGVGKNGCYYLLTNSYI